MAFTRHVDTLDLFLQFPSVYAIQKMRPNWRLLVESAVSAKNQILYYSITIDT